MDDGKARTTPAIRRATKVVRCPIVQTNVRWPAPVDQRLNELVAVVNARGFAVTRSQLLAALVVRALASPDELSTSITEYHQKTAGSVVLQKTGDIQLVERKSGRRPNGIA